MVLTDNEVKQDGSGDSVPLPVDNLFIPFQVEDFIDFIDIHEDGCMLLGSSNLTGKIWNGSIWCFENSDDAPNSEKALTGHGCTYSAACGKFFDSSKKVVIGDDSGCLSYLSIEKVEDRATHFIPHMTLNLHDMSITSMSIAKNNCISGGSDTNIIITDVPTFTAVHKYDGAHIRPVEGISLCPSEEEIIFASCSQDGSLIVWDQRESSPATVISENNPFSYTCLVWKSENEIVAGTNTGQIKIYDTRKLEEIKSRNLIDRPISNVCWNKSGHLAVTGDLETVFVWAPDDDKLVYEDSRHEGMVRALAWHPLKRKFYTGGYHKKVLSHSPSLPS